MMAWYHNKQRNCRVTFLIEKYHKHDRSCYGKTSRTVTQQIVLLAGTDSHHYNHMNKKEHGSIRCRQSRMWKMTFLHKKSIKTSDSFCKTHNEMMIQRQYIHAWEGKASLVPFVMQRHSWWEVVRGGGGHVVGYTSGLYLLFERPLSKSCYGPLSHRKSCRKWDSLSRCWVRSQLEGKWVDGVRSNQMEFGTLN
jgi:hypothetical protein